MARAHRVAAYAAIFSCIYILVFFSIFPVPFIHSSLSDQILPLIPWWILISFGSYSLWSLGWGLFVFQDCPEAYNELLKEINDAKSDLGSKGIAVD